MKLLLTVVILLLIQGCSSTTDQDLEGTWVFEDSKGDELQFVFRGDNFGMKTPKLEIPLPKNDEDKNISRYFVDKSETPYKVYMKVTMFNMVAKEPLGIYKVDKDIMTFCGAMSEREIRDGELTGKKVKVFPKSFKEDSCAVFTKKAS